MFRKNGNHRPLDPPIYEADGERSDNCPYPGKFERPSQKPDAAGSAGLSCIYAAGIAEAVKEVSHNIVNLQQNGIGRQHIRSKTSAMRGEQIEHDQ